MPRIKLPDHKKRTHTVKLSLNDVEFKKFQMLKNRLFNSSPTLSANEFLRKCINSYDSNDYALLKYFGIEPNYEKFMDNLKSKRKYNKKD